jgi:hypothetical protein
MMKSIYDKLRRITSPANDSIVYEISEMIRADEFEASLMRSALDNADILLCPICEEYAKARLCGQGYSATGAREYLRKDKGCSHGGECFCGMVVLDCCEYPVWKRGPGYHYEPINLTGWDFLKRLRAKKAAKDKAAWDRAAAAIRKDEGIMEAHSRCFAGWNFLEQYKQDAYREYMSSRME